MRAAGSPGTRVRPPSAGAVVQPASVDRFAARVRARRRRRWGWALAAAALVVAATWTALLSPWATVTGIEVTGTDRIDAGRVRAAAESELGRSLLLARTDEVAEDVLAEPLVRSVRVRRTWPSTLTLEVVERRAVAAVPGIDGWSLVDEDGITVEQVRRLPSGVPAVRVDLAMAGADSLRACLEVRRGLPAPILRRVRSLGAGSPDHVWLELSGNRRVEWGSAERTGDKARVLQVLLGQKAAVYDVRSPDTPALRRYR